MDEPSAVIEISQMAILFAYLLLSGMLILSMRSVVRWARRVSLTAMFVITLTWAAFYIFVIIWKPLEQRGALLEFAVLFTRLAHIPIIFGVGIMLYMILQSEQTERALIDRFNGEE